MNFCSVAGIPATRVSASTRRPGSSPHAAERQAPSHPELAGGAVAFPGDATTSGQESPAASAPALGPAVCRALVHPGTRAPVMVTSNADG